MPTRTARRGLRRRPAPPPIKSHHDLTFYAALAYGLVLLFVVFGAWLLCDHYREQAQETVIYKQAKEVVRERDYYYNQIQDYKRNNSKYARLFPTYDVDAKNYAKF